MTMVEQSLQNKTVLITGAARRIGRIFALACANAGANVVIHHTHSDTDAETLLSKISKLNRQAWIFKADLSDSSQAQNLIPLINILDWRALRPGADHFPYTISKSALAAMTKSMAVSLAPRSS